ncbi:uncharacterized protein I206_101209 [Kwoniella pini CBS 10737]|uniref:Peroxin-7 n=1 Tax=Kwoniella pini CBS 10737 TaxID=1296096 RepID=A0A1B9IB07_9TREE|nr:uncharacterized protein I206_00114 [Kwoniella pini CBS 10737]OCF52818.1 hypothetical protein I206_00114 [Kwoniella pini CBS 10737]
MTMGQPFLRLKTPKFSHNNLSFSPYFENRFALASGSNFGLVGNGRLHIIDLDQNVFGGLKCIKYFETRDVVFDVAWNETHENQIFAACGDGSIKMFDVTLEGLPIKSWHEHSSEIMSIECSNLQKDKFVTASWDSTVKVWTASRQTSLITIQAHKGQIYQATFSPHNPFLLTSCGSDGNLNLFDLRQQNSNHDLNNSIKPIISINSNLNSNLNLNQEIEILHCDWNKYDENLIAIASKDNLIKTFDFRLGSNQFGKIIGKNQLSCRKIQWNPYNRNQLASVGYDMTCKVWDTNSTLPIFIHSEHTEFTMGICWSLFDPGLLASAAWDQEVHLYRV